MREQQRLLKLSGSHLHPDDGVNEEEHCNEETHIRQSLGTKYSCLETNRNVIETLD